MTAAPLSAVPENGEALAGGTAQGLRDQGSDVGIDSAAADAAAQPLGAKVFATLQARAALAGFELVRMADGSFVVARWTMTRALPDIDAVAAFLRQVGAA